jgi:hypothetical protein
MPLFVRSLCPQRPQGSAEEMQGQGEQQRGMVCSGGRGGGEWLKLTASARRHALPAQCTNFATTPASPPHPLQHAAQHQRGTATARLGPRRCRSVNHIPRPRPAVQAGFACPSPASALAFHCFTSTSARRPLWRCASSCYYPPAVGNAGLLPPQRLRPRSRRAKRANEQSLCRCLTLVAIRQTQLPDALRANEQSRSTRVGDGGRCVRTNKVGRWW